MRVRYSLTPVNARRSDPADHVPECPDCGGPQFVLVDAEGPPELVCVDCTAFDVRCRARFAYIPCPTR